MIQKGLIGFGAATHHPSCRRLPENAAQDREFLIRHGLGKMALGNGGSGGTTTPPAGMSTGAKVAIGVAAVAAVALGYYVIAKPKRRRKRR
jgi:hypothetical protein